MPARRTMPTHLTRRLSRLLALLMIYSLVGGSFPPPIAASHPAGDTSAVPAPTLSRATTSAHASVYLPIIATSGGSTSTPTPTALPSATPTATPTGTPGATPTATPTGTPGATPASTPTGIPGTTPTSTPLNTPTAPPPAPDTQPPAAPTNLRLNEKTDTTIGLLWDASTDNVAVTGYDILIGAALVASTSGANGTANGLTPDTSYTFTVRAKDAAGNLSAASEPIRIRTKRVDGLPYDPAVIAPPVDQTTVSDFAADTQFLYTGPDAIQTGVAPGTIDGRRVAVLRGLVLTRDDAPLPGVTISVLGHPEYGQTASRADGVFDLAVNGGGLLTLNYTRAGYLPSQRQITAPWRDYAWLPDVALIPLDPAVTELNLTGAGALQVAHGSVVSDTDGVRQATLMFPADVTATLVYSDNTSVPLTTLHVRATEYTVGASGPKAMPGPLPVNSAYTYAAEFSADEAIAAGAKTVRFSRPIVDYTENFLDFPVGTTVPNGYYDRAQGRWKAAANGL
ncbi:MAG TPA: fibronectin type III domain-containing protein, partial [Roseiflexaceae bacterium]